VYACIAVGDNPHPSPKPETRIALLNNRPGAYHNWVTTGNPTPNYKEPRLMGGQPINANRLIKGQSYAITNYDDLMALHQNEKYYFELSDSIRIINLGPNVIHIKGFWIVYHGEVK
jgi:hypothetical protein